MIISFAVGLDSTSIAQNENLEQCYNNWENLLQRHVNDDGLVDYQGFVDDKSKLKKVTSTLSENTPKESWTRNEKKAYLINAYNAFTIQLIVDNYPLESIKNIGKEPFDAFKLKFIDLGGEMVSLDDIEKGMLVPMGDPRVHFAVNCASFSCPKLDNKAYRPEKLNKHLERCTREFLNSDLNNLSKNKVEISRLFDWYKIDFETNNRTLIQFLNTYSETKINPKAELSYLEYRWDLNSK
jgi:hypothetical protein